jgi:hypothetical protein
MMNKQTLFIALFLCMNLLSSAATFTVNNNNPSPGQYTTIQAAMNAAANGDIILINGSPNTYSIGANFITKSLTFIGAGYNPTKDNPLLTRINFNGYSSTAANVTLKGLVFMTTTYIGGANTTISECYFAQRLTLYSGATGLIARNNIFAFSEYAAINFDGGGNNATFENNIFTTGVQFYNASIVSGLILRNNVFLGGSASNLVSLGNPTNWTFQNNIFWNVFIGSRINCVFINNIAYSPEGNTSVPITNGSMNVGNFNANPQFINYSGGGFSSAHNYRLQAASVGHLAGTDGTDIGAFGGATPYTDHGMPNIPVVKVMNITAGAVPVGGTIQVTFQSDIQN